jgi:hypothetical protein
MPPNFGCALMLARWRHAAGSLTRAAFLSARNDTIANVAIIAAGVLTAATASPWPDLVVGLGIFAMNLGAARRSGRQPIGSTAVSRLTLELQPRGLLRHPRGLPLPRPKGMKVVAIRSCKSD